MHELSALLSCSNKQPPVLKAKNMFCFIWPLSTGLTVCIFCTGSNPKSTMKYNGCQFLNKSAIIISVDAIIMSTHNVNFNGQISKSIP